MDTQTPFHTPNRHALACILEAAETRSIISATDIFDIQGIKLWARNQPVTAELQRKLADRRLQTPLETSLLVEDGVTVQTLGRALVTLVEGPGALAPLLRPQAARLLRELPGIPLLPAVQLLLSASQSARPVAFDHAIAAMALNGALAANAGADTREVRLALLAGLLHDLGEMYIAPRHGEDKAERELDFTAYQQLVVHPHVGFLLIKQLTTYAPSVAEAVAMHHERLDGSGYPRARPADEIPPAARLLMVTEATLAALRDPGSPLLHASVALRAVPGEFDPAWAGQVSRAARGLPEAVPVMDRDDIQARLGALDGLLQRSEQAARTLQQQAGDSGLQQAAELASYLLGRVRTGWNESGLWSTEQVAAGAQAAEVEAVEDELYRRLRGVQRAARLRAGKLPEAEAARLEAFCELLEGVEGADATVGPGGAPAPAALPATAAG